MKLFNKAKKGQILQGSIKSRKEVLLDNLEWVDQDAQCDLVRQALGIVASLRQAAECGVEFEPDNLAEALGSVEEILQLLDVTIDNIE